MDPVVPVATYDFLFSAIAIDQNVGFYTNVIASGIDYDTALQKAYLLLEEKSLTRGLTVYMSEVEAVRQICSATPLNMGFAMCGP